MPRNHPLPLWILLALLAVGSALPQDLNAEDPLDEAGKLVQEEEELPDPKTDADRLKEEQAKSRRDGLLAGLTIFVLAIFVGFEMITKVPPTLHTPLMSGANAISGITLVGAVIIAGAAFRVSTLLGFIAVILASVNVVGGFLVTHRMLAMFKR